MSASSYLRFNLCRYSLFSIDIILTIFHELATINIYLHIAAVKKNPHADTDGALQETKKKSEKKNNKDTYDNNNKKISQNCDDYYPINGNCRDKHQNNIKRNMHNGVCFTFELFSNDSLVKSKKCCLMPNVSWTILNDF